MMGTDIVESLILSRSAVSRLVQRGRKITIREKPLLQAEDSTEKQVDDIINEGIEFEGIGRLYCRGEVLGVQ